MRLMLAYAMVVVMMYHEGQVLIPSGVLSSWTRTRTCCSVDVNLEERYVDGRDTLTIVEALAATLKASEANVCCQELQVISSPNSRLPKNSLKSW